MVVAKPRIVTSFSSFFDPRIWQLSIGKGKGEGEGVLEEYTFMNGFIAVFLFIINSSARRTEKKTLRINSKGLLESMKMTEEKKCPVNLRLLPIKSHYFFFFGAMGGVIPFMPVLAKGLGINATAVGLIYTVLPFCVFFSKPLFGYITDYFQNIKLIVFLLVCVTSVGYVSVIFLPSIDNAKWTQVQTQCQPQSDFWSIFTDKYEQKCLRDSLKQSEVGELSFKPCDRNFSVNLYGKVSLEQPGSMSNDEFSNDTMWLKFKPDTNFSCGCIADNSSIFKCESINSCLLNGVTSSVYRTYQFWVFTLLAVIAGTGSATVFCLSDAACYEVLGEHTNLYGKQRMWATISWGAVTLLAGFFNDIATGESSVTNYAPGFYLMLALVAIDLILLLKIQLTKANLSLNIWSDVGKIFSSCETVCFATAVYIIGALTGLIWNYQFWFLQDLGATQTLLGLCVAVQCLVAEVPFFFFAGWFIKVFGYFNCLTGSFCAFAIRLGLYYILENPWMVLPIEVLHGLTFAVFYASMTGYASENAPPGTEATMMGILGGLFEGLGVASGSLLGGFGFDKLGGRKTFLVAAVVSVICAPSLALVTAIRRKLLPKGSNLDQ
ncbi:major facilitator superfamily domain-containing protein 6-B [Nephila pilipes]|uniref:Major facilitator superfamily domain-containing protein 6-B n=1 Tax=Nephila pilipes TaxID=299642 RepID=A0A8X6TST9_NEPPI|nr:major facilitator superfamily domain-containing protein 6-B [Nephila pilipes]